MLFEKVPYKEVSKYGIAKLEKSFYSHKLLQEYWIF